jgi:hypothetical protein
MLILPTDMPSEIHFFVPVFVLCCLLRDPFVRCIQCYVCPSLG